MTIQCDISPNTLSCVRCGARVSSAGVRRNCGSAPLPELPPAAAAVAGELLESGYPAELPAPARHAGPGFLEKVKNLATAAAGHVAAGLPMCSDEEIIRRHDICLGCEFFKDDACTLCGCPLSRTFGYVSKLSWADQECPAGKWGKASPPPGEPPDGVK